MDESRKYDSHATWARRGAWLPPAMLAVSLLLSCVLMSRKKYYWNDELYSWLFLSDPSFFHMMGAFHAPINNTPGLYFMLGWPWARLFGAGELSLRLFSSLAMAAAAFLAWAALRKAFHHWAATLGTLSVFGMSWVVLEQNAEARMYGLYLAAAAWCLLLYMRTEEGSTRWAPHFAAHAALAHVHLFGAFYSAAFLFAMLLRDGLWRGRWQPRLYLAIIAAWASIALYLPAFFQQAQAGAVRAWIPWPRLGDLWGLLSLDDGALGGLIALLVLLVAAAGARVVASVAPPPEKMTASGRARSLSLLLLAFALLAVPVVTWAISRTMKPILIDRYVLPSALAWCILSAYLVDRLWPAPGEGWRRAVDLGLRGALIVFFTLQPLWYAHRFHQQTMPGADDEKFGHGELPIVSQTGSQFLMRQYYAPRPERYFFVLDEEAALAEESGQYGPQEHRHMEAIRRHYAHVFKGRIMDGDDFLREHREFLIVDYPDYGQACPRMVSGGWRHARAWEGLHCPQWVEMRLLARPERYHIVFLGELHGESMLLVARRQGTPLENESE
jgi:hypothetical protein